jgi:hypothetical protein
MTEFLISQAPSVASSVAPTPDPSAPPSPASEGGAGGYPPPPGTQVAGTPTVSQQYSRHNASPIYAVR